MKKFLIVIIVLLFTAGFAYAHDCCSDMKEMGNNMFMKQAGDYMVHLKMDKESPVAGENKVEIFIQDKSGAYVTDAAVAIEYLMPAMPAMPGMPYKSATELKDKQYNATLNFSMAGTWSVDIKINQAGKMESVKFDMNVS